MDMITEIQQSTDDFNAICQERDKAEAYLSITQAMGPSAQLIAFINYDQQLGSELGLESFDTLDLESQHAFLSMSLDIDALDKIACENLTERVRKVAFFLNKVPIPFLPLITSVVLKATETDATVYHKQSYDDAVKQFEELYKYELEFTSAIPSTFVEKDWAKFNTRINGGKIRQFFLGKKKKEAGKVENSYNTVPFKESGWNPTDYVSGLNWLKANVVKIEFLQKKCAEKFKKIEDWLTSSDQSAKSNKAITKYISETIGMSLEAFHESELALHEVRKILESAGHHFQAE